MYVNSFGDKKNPSIVFIHGGPGFDSQDFEFSTAAKLAGKGFYVIVYDQRGQGRSELAKSQLDYGYKKYADDLELIIKRLGLTHPTLLGHSHGGTIALKFDQFYSGVASKIILISAPINFFRSLESIQVNCSSRYSANGGTAFNRKIDFEFSVLNSKPSFENEIGAVADIFQLALKKPCSLYTQQNPTQAALSLQQVVLQMHAPISQENLIYPLSNFIVNEQYIYVDQTQWVKTHADHIFGIYGSEDGLFTSDVFNDIQADLAANSSRYRFQVIDGSAHSVYIDQQDKFIDALMKDLK